MMYQAFVKGSQPYQVRKSFARVAEGCSMLHMTRWSLVRSVWQSVVSWEIGSAEYVSVFSSVRSVYV